MTTTTATLRQYDLYIDGRHVPSATGETFESINPATGEGWYTAALADQADVDRAVSAARRALSDPAWRDISQTQRGAMLRRLADLIASNAEPLAQAEVVDTGKLIREMRGQMARLPEWYHYYAGLADKVLGDVIPNSPSILNYALREPVGVCAGIIGWNSPLLLATRKICPALAMGNTLVLKPSEHTSASLLDLMPLFEEAGFPAGVVNVVTGAGETGAALASHPGIDKISFTGGPETGAKIAASAARNHVRVTLELGGKSPQIVFSDANPSDVAIGLVAGIFAATGQTCVAGSRALIHKKVYDDVLQHVVDRGERIKMGDPMDVTTEMGPLAFQAQLDKVERLVDAGKQEGAELVTGGRRPPAMGGLFFEPTVFTNVGSDMTIAREEIFGPVMAALPFETEEEAIQIANDTRFGLAAGVWTRDLARAHRVAKAVNAGVVWINTYRAISATAPFGGFKSSGMGKEDGFESIMDYTRYKSVWVNLSDDPPADPFVIA
jgi:acyl-CoA reductase-like NAD-dependent aldehyde dehydrogenase